MDSQAWTARPLLPHEELALAIFRHAESNGPRQWHDTTINALVAAAKVESRLVLDRLEALVSRGCLEVQKWFDPSGFVPYGPNGSSTEKFFLTGPFQIKLTPTGREYYQELERKERQSNESQLKSGNDLVFISCGQFLEQEIRLGEDLERAVHDLTTYKGYFAKNQSSLQSLSQNVFAAMDRMAAFVAVLHHRGNVATTQPPVAHTRGSVWVEQEIAIAAFLTATRDRVIPVQIYVQKGITLEGVREQLQLNPFQFEREDEVVAHFEGWLRAGKHIPGSTQGADQVEAARLRLVQEELAGSPASHLRLLHHLSTAGKTSKRDLEEKWPDALDVLSKGAIVEREEQPASWSSHWIKPEIRSALDRYLLARGVDGLAD